MFWNKFWGRPRFISFVICGKILTVNTMMIKDIFFSKTWWLIPNASGWTPAVTLRSMFNICATVCAGYPPLLHLPALLQQPSPDFPSHVCFTSSQVDETKNTTEVQFQWTPGVNFVFLLYRANNSKFCWNVESDMNILLEFLSFEHNFRRRIQIHVKKWF